MLRMAEAGYRTGIIDLTAGEMGTRGTAEQRLQRRRPQRGVKVSQRENMRFPDTKLLNWAEYRERLALAIRQAKPRVVIIPIGRRVIPIITTQARLLLTHAFFPVFASSIPPPSLTGVQSNLFIFVRQRLAVFRRRYHRQFDRRMESLFCYESQYGAQEPRLALFPDQQEIRDRFAGIALLWKSDRRQVRRAVLVKETMRVDDIVTSAENVLAQLFLQVLAALVPASNDPSTTPNQATAFPGGAACTFTTALPAAASRA